MKVEMYPGFVKVVAQLLGENDSYQVYAGTYPTGEIGRLAISKKYIETNGDVITHRNCPGSPRITFVPNEFYDKKVEVSI